MKQHARVLAPHHGIDAPSPIQGRVDEERASLLDCRGDQPVLLALGPLSIGYRGAIGKIGGPKQQVVLGVLLESRGRSVSIEKLVDCVWPDEAPKSARGTTHSYLSNLRKVLGDLMTSEVDSYRIEVSSDNFDVLCFEQAVAAGRSKVATDPEESVRLFRAALDLWRGDPFMGLTDCPVLADEAARLSDVRLGVLEDCLDIELALGNHAQIVPELEWLVASNSLRERLIGQLMLALFRSGRRTDALEVYDRAHEELFYGFGIAPGRELQELEQRIRRHTLTNPPP